MNKDIKQLVLEITSAAIEKKSEKGIDVFVRLYPHVGEMDVEIQGKIITTEYIPKWEKDDEIIINLIKIKNKVLAL